MQRKRGQSLRRDIGILGNFAFAYGDVAEGVYFTLGLVLLYAGAAATYAYVFATIAYVLTAICYAELSSSYHQAGGAFIFAKKAFGRRVAFLAAWALLLDYLVTTAISAVAAVGYVGYFFPVLNTVAGIVTVSVILGLLAINILGIGESARFSYFLVMFDLVGEAVVLAIGFVLSYHPALNAPPVLGSTPTYPNLLYAVTIAMSSYLGIEVVSQSSGETKHAGKNIPRAIFLISIAVVAATLAYSTLALGVVPYQAFQNNPAAINYPVSFIASRLPFGWVLGGLTAILGISVLIVAANAGIVGVSRITYAMSDEGVIPKVFSRLHKRYKTPFVSIVVFSSIAIAIVVAFSAELDILAEMYNFGALIAYMIVGLSLISLRNKEKNLVRPFKAPWSIRIKRKTQSGGQREYEVPILAAACFAADLTIWLLVVVLHPIGREVGTVWIILGLLIYYLYSRIHRVETTPLP
ncbi:MAG: APC family permease [Thaumarchaeota archaeon]|nr:APC family permease [Nitrososphaerota archaeon]